MTAEFTTGQHIGDYEIQSILGAGGMGKVLPGSQRDFGPD